jgi:hypothetical protein
MAQRQRAGLITPRTQDRNLLPVSIIHRIGASRHLSNTYCQGVLKPLPSSTSFVPVALVAPSASTSLIDSLVATRFGYPFYS